MGAGGGSGTTIQVGGAWEGGVAKKARGPIPLLSFLELNCCGAAMCAPGGLRDPSLGDQALTHGTL